MPTTNRNVSESLQAACRVLRHRVLFKSAGFTLPGSPYMQDDTAVIREATRLYTQSWVIPILDAIETGDTRMLKKLCERNEQEPISE